MKTLRARQRLDLGERNPFLRNQKDAQKTTRNRFARKLPKIPSNSLLFDFEFLLSFSDQIDVITVSKLRLLLNRSKSTSTPLTAKPEKKTLVGKRKLFIQCKFISDAWRLWLSCARVT